MDLIAQIDSGRRDGSHSSSSHKGHQARRRPDHVGWGERDIGKHAAGGSSNI